MNNTDTGIALSSVELSMGSLNLAGIAGALFLTYYFSKQVLKRLDELKTSLSTQQKQKMVEREEERAERL